MMDCGKTAYLMDSVKLFIKMGISIKVILLMERDMDGELMKLEIMSIKEIGRMVKWKAKDQ